MFTGSSYADSSSPPRVKRPDWSPSGTRTLPITPLICLDALHPSLIPDPEVLPGMIVTLASSLSPLILEHVQSLSVSHGIPSFICAADGGTSAVIDPWGRILFQQTGGESFVVKIAVPYSGERSRAKTGREVLGATGVLGLGASLVGVGMLGRRLRVAHWDQLRGWINVIIARGWQRLVGQRAGRGSAATEGGPLI